MINKILIPQMQTRDYYGSLFEPENHILSGAGQDFPAWKQYQEMLSAENLSADFFMEYVGVRGLTKEKLEQRILPYLDNAKDGQPILQLGLSMTTDGQPEKAYEVQVADGLHDSAIEVLGDFFLEHNLSVLLRIGYECSSPWNGYSAESYIKAYRRIAGMIRRKTKQVAMVWCVEGGWINNAFPYYPGDEWVDWCSIDLFAFDHFKASEPFIEFCREIEKPILVGECTPRRVGVMDGETSWANWFGPFVEWLAANSNVKGFSYINWNWSHYPQWKDWGDARIAQNETVRSAWIEFLLQNNSLTE